MTGTDFTTLTDLASRALGGSVSAANDELFAQRENLIKPDAPLFDPADFGHKGKVYDGWETRRRRDEGGHDWAIVRLGAPGIVHGVVVDTAHFTGNYPPFVSVEAASIEGYPSIEDVQNAEWHAIVDNSPAAGDTANRYEVADRQVARDDVLTLTSGSRSCVARSPRVIKSGSSCAIAGVVSRSTSSMMSCFARSSIRCAVGSGQLFCSSRER